MRFGELNQGRVILWIASAAAVFTFIFGLWLWFGWRIEPGPNEFYVLIAKTGNELPPGQILAEPGQKGVQKNLIEAGRHFYNPICWDWERCEMTIIQAGKVGVQVARSGKELSAGRVVAERGEKGVQKEVLLPGSYRINPYEYSVEIRDAVTVPPGSFGVVTAKIGQDPSPGHILVKDGERGVQESMKGPGTYYVNPFVYQIDSISLRSHQLEVTKEKGEEIEFPSSDGFPIEIDAAIEWRVKADRVAEVFVRLGDEKDILDKVIRPNTRSISRIEGSKYAAKDFISGAGREKFEESFHKQLSMVCEAKGIEILRSLVRKIIVPEQIAKPIREAEVARQEKVRNEEQIKTQESAAQLAEKQALVEQRKRQVEAETKKIEARTEAEKEKEVAEIAVQTARQKSEAVKISADAEAEAARKRLTAEADGMKMKVQAFGSGEAYAMYHFTQMVSQHTSFVFAPVGQGTFWTDPQAFLKLATQKLAADQQEKK